MSVADAVLFLRAPVMLVPGKVQSMVGRNRLLRYSAVTLVRKEGSRCAGKVLDQLVSCFRLIPCSTPQERYTVIIHVLTGVLWNTQGVTSLLGAPAAGVLGRLEVGLGGPLRLNTSFKLLFLFLAPPPGAKAGNTPAFNELVSDESCLLPPLCAEDGNTSSPKNPSNFF